MCNWHLRPKYMFLSMHIFRGSNLCYIELWSCLIWHILLIISLLYMLCYDQCVFKCISNQVIGILKGNWSLRRRQRFPLHSTTHSSPSLRFTLRLWYNLHSYVLFAKGEKVVWKGLYFTQSIRFWRFMPKGEKVLAQSKRTAPPTT
jgi:hypothetical protein